MILIIDSEIKIEQLSQSDSQQIFNTIDSQRAYLGKWLPFVELTKVLKDTENFVDSVVNAPKDSFEYVFTIRKQGRFVGLIGFKGTDKLNQKTELGYWLSEKYQGQGIVTKAVKKLVNFAFNELGINRIQIKCATGNAASSNIPKNL